MRTVEDETGRRYVLLKNAEESSLVRHVESGTERYMKNDQLSVVEAISPLEHVATAVPANTRKLLTAVPNTRGLGLLLDLSNRGPLAVRAMLDAYDYCESDLHGLLAEFTAAGLIETVDIGGERGYDISAEIKPVVESLKTDVAEES